MAKKNLADELATWLARLVRGQPKASVVAFNVGLAETGRGFRVYLVGADTFDDTGDWACRPTYRSKDEITVPKSQAADWQAALQAVRDAVRAFLTTDAGQASFLGRAIVTVGFDDGDLERLR